MSTKWFEFADWKKYINQNDALWKNWISRLDRNNKQSWRKWETVQSDHRSIALPINFLDFVLQYSWPLDRTVYLYRVNFDEEKVWLRRDIRLRVEPKPSITNLLLSTTQQPPWNVSIHLPRMDERAVLQPMWFSLVKQILQPNSQHDYLCALLLVLLDLFIPVLLVSCTIMETVCSHGTIVCLVHTVLHNYGTWIAIVPLCHSKCESRLNFDL